VVQDDNRYFRELQLPCGDNSAVARDDAGIAVDQDRRMDEKRAGIWDQLIEWQVLDILRFRLQNLQFFSFHNLSLCCSLTLVGPASWVQPQMITGGAVEILLDSQIQLGSLDGGVAQRVEFAPIAPRPDAGIAPQVNAAAMTGRPFLSSREHLSHLQANGFVLSNLVLIS
jgi:hypothetical protein